jgi:hypothetical protein
LVAGLDKPTPLAATTTSLVLMLVASTALAKTTSLLATVLVAAILAVMEIFT